MKTIEHNGLDVAKIAPKCGAKYSENLYKWLNSEHIKDRAWALRVYRDNEGALWIGMLDHRELIGTRLIGVLCHGARETTAAYQGIDAAEIPDFWAHYTADGRCAIDRLHTMNFIDDKTRWSVVGHTRQCLWCGKATQHLHQWTANVQREEWINPEPLETASPLYEEWEEAIYQQIETVHNMTRSDARGIVMGQAFAMAQAWGLGQEAIEAAKTVIDAATPAAEMKTIGDLVNTLDLFRKIEWASEIRGLSLDSESGKECAVILTKGDELAAVCEDVKAQIMIAVVSQVNTFYFG